ncbi:MAG: DUF6103 family protein [Eubacteriales bacterium]
MKDTDITISFNSEKLDALNFYMNKKDSDVQGELEETVQGLYLKHVPAPTREYIEDRLEREGNPTTTNGKATKKPVPTVKKNPKKEKKEDSKATQTPEPKADATEENPEVTEPLEEKVEEPSTQDKVDELINGTSDGSDGNTSGNSSGDGFLDGLLN